MNSSKASEPGDPWGNAATRFYDQRAGSKSNPTVFNRFVDAYRRLRGRFPQIEGSRILDVGCGTGILCAALSEKSESYVGVDLSEESLRVASQASPDGNFVHADMTQLPFEAETFDFAFAITSLEFCADKSRALGEVARCLKKDGYFYLEVRNRDFIVFRILGPIRRLRERTRLVVPYPADGFRDLIASEWRQAMERRFSVKSEYASLRPWNYGSLLTRLKNALITLTRAFFPVQYHYMIGYLCCKKEQV